MRTLKAKPGGGKRFNELIVLNAIPGGGTLRGLRAVTRGKDVNAKFLRTLISGYGKKSRTRPNK